MKDFDLSRQILRSGTAVGALIREAQNTESKKDFIHKLAIAQKECDETIFWLELLFASEELKENEFSSLNSDAVELYKMIISSIITIRKNMNLESDKK
jgi:four helix bundle protein